jgi:hypothetical protein
MGTLWNTYAFYVLYANIDGFDPTKYTLNRNTLSVMDKWILSKLNTAVKTVDKQLDAYKIIERVYTWHPSIPDIGGKAVIAQLYKLGGMTLMRDMDASAVKAESAYEEKRKLTHELQEKRAARAILEQEAEECLAIMERAQDAYCKRMEKLRALDKEIEELEANRANLIA